MRKNSFLIRCFVRPSLAALVGANSEGTDVKEIKDAVSGDPKVLAFDTVDLIVRAIVQQEGALASSPIRHTIDWTQRGH